MLAEADEPAADSADSAEASDVAAAVRRAVIVAASPTWASPAAVAASSEAWAAVAAAEPGPVIVITSLSAPSVPPSPTVVTTASPSTPKECGSA